VVAISEQANYMKREKGNEKRKTKLQKLKKRKTRIKANYKINSKLAK